MARGMTNMDYADYELLRVIQEVEEKQNTEGLSEMLDANTSSMASRLSWMKRMGFVSRTPAQRWVLTPRGEEILNGRSEDIFALRQIADRTSRSRPMRWAMKREARRDLG